MSAPLIPYNRRSAVEYAHTWAYGRNPAYYDYQRLGGDCTNFASQCLYAGAPVMNWRPETGWYYQNANRKAPAWTGVEFLFRFLTRQEESPGPVAVLVPLENALPGDFVQLRFPGASSFGHTPVIVSVGPKPAPDNLLLAAHSMDTDYRPLDTYNYAQLRILHILGARKD